MSRTRTRSKAVSTSTASNRRQLSLHIKHGVLHVHKDYEGLLQLCYYATGLREGGPNDGYAAYACFNMQDKLCARRARFHLEPISNL